MKNILIFIFACLLVFVDSNQDPLPEWEDYALKLQEIQGHLDDRFNEGTPLARKPYFNTTFTSPPQSLTVHTLRPQDIDVIGALGDSITAGTGIDADTIVGLLIQFKGLTWTAGGDGNLSSSITIPNILRHFNPEVKGYSVGSGIFTREEDDWYNVAVPGARADDMPGQARVLIDRMKNDSKTNFENDWKLISIFIGGNDLCAIDRDPDGTRPEVYRNYIKEAIDMFHDELPRAMIQIVQIMEIYHLPHVADGFGAGRFCRIAQQLLCGYVASSKDDETIRNELNAINWEYQRLLEELVDSGRYDTRDDFTVVLQPFFKDTVLPYTENGEVDATYFAPDCFHFSSKGHAMGAVNLWNNMFEPEGNKTTRWKITDLMCPTEEQPYIFTRKNSPTSGTSDEDADNFADNPVTCAELICNNTPDWVIGVISALAAAAAIQLIVLLFVLSTKSVM